MGVESYFCRTGPGNRQLQSNQYPEAFAEEKDLAEEEERDNLGKGGFFGSCQLPFYLTLLIVDVD